VGKIELDHLMVCVDPDGPEAEALVEFGLVPGQRGIHAGQGTANVIFFFRNAYLELIWVEDANELSRPPVNRTGLARRLRWRETGASPFGVSFRPTAGPDQPLPIETWPYRAPFLPVGVVPIPVGVNSDVLAEPLAFASLVSARPDARSPRPPLQEASGFGEITGLSITVVAEQLSPTLQQLETAGIARFRRGTSHHAVVEIDGGYAGNQRDFSPLLPLTLRW